MDRLCVCGQTLGKHDAAYPHPCYDDHGVVWACDAGAARIRAKWCFIIKHGYEPTHIDEPTIYARRSPVLLSALAGIAAAISLRDGMAFWGESDPYRAYHRMHGGNF